MGWGALKYKGPAPNKLQNVNTTVLNQELCSDVYPEGEKNWKSQLCAGKEYI